MGNGRNASIVLSEFLSNQYRKKAELKIIKLKGQSQEFLREKYKRQTIIYYHYMFFSIASQRVKATYLQQHTQDACNMAAASIIHLKIPNMRNVDGM